ncbi:MAG: diacylglycerol kinase family protein [Opitutaceae bacterium]
MKTRFIVNPRSGGAARVLDRVQTFASTLGDADVVQTTHQHHATELAAQGLAEGCGLIVAVGGDGTLNEVATSLIQTSATFGLIPCGSGNGLGRHLGIHGNLTRALEILRTGQPRLIDTGLADGHPFFTAAGLGFEAEVSARFNQLKNRGFFRYLTTSLKLWRRQIPELCRISCDGRTITARAFTLAVANSDQYGNDAFIAPGAQVDDGRLDLTLIPPVTLPHAVPMFIQLFAHTIGSVPGVIRLQSSGFVVERDAPGLIHTDGETHSAGSRVEFVIRPSSLRIMAPARNDLELVPTDPSLVSVPSTAN